MVGAALRRPLLAVAALSMLLLVTPPPATATTTYGELSNFDVFNDTGEPTHGFEIELDGISNSDISYTFGGTGSRYGDPRIVDFDGGVYVRYESPYDVGNRVFTQTTQMASANHTATDGHSCWAGGYGDYDHSGCEHFGVQLTRAPTNTVYRWLVADPANPGRLKASGSDVGMPAPTWNVSPPPPGAPNQEPVVAAVVQAPEPGAYDFGDAQWVKVYKTESPAAAELNHLLTDDPAVPQDPAETETEWFLLQAEVGHANPGSKLANEAQTGQGNESVTRRYEIYAYAGAYDPQNHEARPIDDTNPVQADVGNYLGAQMVALNVGPQAPPAALAFGSSPLTIGEVGVSYAATLVRGGVPSYAITVAAGALPAGLTANADGTLTGTPSAAGSYPFTIEATDQAQHAGSGSFDLTIVPPVAITTDRLPIGSFQRPYSATLSATDGVTPYEWSLASGTLPRGLTLDGATGVISGVPQERVVLASLTVTVTDALGAKATKTLSLTVL